MRIIIVKTWKQATEIIMKSSSVNRRVDTKLLKNGKIELRIWSKK